MTSSIRHKRFILLATGAVVVVALGVLYLLGSVLLAIGLSGVIAYTLLPVVKLLEWGMPWRRRHPDLSRVTAIVIVFIVALGAVAGVLLVRRQNKWDKRGAFKACNLDANRLRQFSDLPTSVRLDSFASPPVSSPVWRLAVRGTYPPA